jgi:hypothetical protein
MFVVTEADAAAVRAVFEQEGELSAAIEVRRLFPGVTDNAEARAHARTIAGWKPLPVPMCTVTPLHPARKPGARETPYPDCESLSPAGWRPNRLARIPSGLDPTQL